MDWDAAVLSDRGRWRHRNEDAAVVRPEKRLYAVADGMGGHVAGDIASRTAVERLDTALDAGVAAAPAMDAADRLRRAIASANAAVLERAEHEADKRGMGTTIAALLALHDDATCVIGHIGDSRVYRLRRGVLDLLTTDHTWVQERVAAGELTAVEARAHPYSSVLTRVLGLPDVGAADITVADVTAGDTFLLCTDGLTGMLEERDLVDILARAEPADALAAELVDAANARGGLDNITVVVLKPT